MISRRKFSLKIFWIGMLILLMTSPLLAANQDVANTFRKALQNKNIKQLTKIIHPQGLIVARSYNKKSPNRGQEFFQRVSRLTPDFQVAAGSELPLDFLYLFGGTTRVKNLKRLNQDWKKASFDPHSLDSLRVFATRVISFVTKKAPGFTPTVVRVNDDYLVLTEAEVNNGLLSGAVAVFWKGYLRAVIDFR